MSSDEKDRKNHFIVQEIELFKNQSKYQINTDPETLSKLVFCSQAKGKNFYIMPSSEFEIKLESGIYYIYLTSSALEKYSKMQINKILEIESGNIPSNPNINVIIDEHNKLYKDVQKIWDLFNQQGIQVNSKYQEIILPELDIAQIWVKDNDGKITAFPLTMLDNVLGSRWIENSSWNGIEYIVVSNKPEYKMVSGEYLNGNFEGITGTSQISMKVDEMASYPVYLQLTEGAVLEPATGLNISLSADYTIEYQGDKFVIQPYNEKQSVYSSLLEGKEKTIVPAINDTYYRAIEACYGVEFGFKQP